MNEETPTPSPVTSQRRTLTYRSLSGQLPLILALVIIGGLLLIWKPWQSQPQATDRTITVSGSAEITAEPDEYTFNPQYTFKNADQKTALADATTKTSEVVAQLKKLGVPDSKIKTNTSGYQSYYDSYGDTYYAYLTIVAGDKALAQKVQDYLLTTTPTGSVSPQANFSKAKRTELTDQARDQATKAARKKADQSADNLGFKIGKVKSVTDSPDDSIFPRYYASDTLSAGADSAASAKSAPIQQGENNLTYEVKVVYYLR